MEVGPDSGGGAALRRRQALLAGGGAAAAIALAACGSGGDETGGDETGPGAGEGDEVTTLGRLIELERRAVDTYEEGARFAVGELELELLALAEQSLAHVRALEPLIVAAGGSIPPATEPRNPAFVRDGDSARRAAIANGRRVVRAYVEAIPALPSPALRRELMPILANDAQHLVVLGGLPASSAAPGGTDG